MAEDKCSAFRERMRVNLDASKIDTNHSADSLTYKNSDGDPYKEERQRSLEEERGREKRNKPSNFSNEEIKGAFVDLGCLSGEKKVALVEKIIDLESLYLKINAPTYLFYHDGQDESYGYYKNTENTIFINDAKPFDSYKDYLELLDTVIHEIRHAYQYEAIEYPEEHPEIKEMIRQYLEYSDMTYPEDITTADYYEKYIQNGLEIDTQNYTKARVEIYKKYSADEILHLAAPPKRECKNQILMEPGDISQRGVIAPITTNTSFDKNVFKEQKDNFPKKKGDNMSQGTGTTDFSEKAQGEAVKVYQQVIESIQSFSEKMIQNLTERIKSHPYKQLENVTNTFIVYYNDKLPGEIKEAIRTWISSEASFLESLRKHNENDEDASIRAAEKLQEGLNGMVDEAFHSIEKVKINKPIDIDIDRIQQEAMYVESYYKELGHLRDDWIEKFRNFANQNSIYANMSSMVVDTFKHVEKIYTAAQKEIINVGDEFANAWSSVISTGFTRSGDRAKNHIDISSCFSSMRHL